MGGGSGSSGAHAEATVQRGQRPGHGTSFLQRILNTHSWLQRKGGRRDGKGTVSQWQGTARTAEQVAGQLPPLRLRRQTCLHDRDFCDPRQGPDGRVLQGSHLQQERRVPATARELQTLVMQLFCVASIAERPEIGSPCSWCSRVPSLPQARSSGGRSPLSSLPPWLGAALRPKRNVCGAIFDEDNAQQACPDANGHTPRWQRRWKQHKRESSAEPSQSCQRFSHCC